MRTIKCQICGKEVEAKSSRQKYCPECAKEKERARDRERYENNKEKYRERYENNKDKHKEWYENNKEDIKKRQRERYQKDTEYREKKKERDRERRLNDPNYRKEQNKRRLEQWHKKYGYAQRDGSDYCIYIHTDPVGKVYVGRASGCDVKTVEIRRWGSNGKNYQGQKFYNECIAVYGWDNIQHELLEWGLTYEEVIEREQYWIERYNSRNPEYGYNVA